MNKTEIKNLLIAHGVNGVISAKDLAKILGFATNTINDAKLRGELRSIDRGTYALNAVVDWLYARQRFLTRITTPQPENREE